MAQLDSNALRARYGEPLDRETFRLPAGFDLMVDYGVNKQVCRLEVPAYMPTKENPSNSDVMRQRMYDFLADLVPMSMRGKELGRGTMAMGTMSMFYIHYEHAALHEGRYANDEFGPRNTIVLTLQNANCAAPSAPSGQ